VFGWVAAESSVVTRASCERLGESSGLAIRRPPSAWERLRSPFMVDELSLPQGQRRRHFWEMAKGEWVNGRDGVEQRSMV